MTSSVHSKALLIYWRHFKPKQFGSSAHYKCYYYIRCSVCRKSRSSFSFNDSSEDNHNSLSWAHVEHEVGIAPSALHVLCLRRALRGSGVMRKLRINYINDGFRILLLISFGRFQIEAVLAMLILFLRILKNFICCCLEP